MAGPPGPAGAACVSWCPGISGWKSTPPAGRVLPLPGPGEMYCLTFMSGASSAPMFLTLGAFLPSVVCASISSMETEPPLAYFPCFSTRSRSNRYLPYSSSVWLLSICDTPSLRFSRAPRAMLRMSPFFPANSLLRFAMCCLNSTSAGKLEPSVPRYRPEKLVSYALFFDGVSVIWSGSLPMTVLPTYPLGTPRSAGSVMALTISSILKPNAFWFSFK